jgi:tripartite-type tricarboxylate transporter receptor subunit TctC
MRCDIGRRALSLAAIGAVLTSRFAAAQRTSQPVRLIVPYAAGGPVDILARVLAPALQSALNEVVIVENKPGAGSLIGARMVATAPRDGKTILIGNVSTYAILPATTNSPGFDPEKAFAPLGVIADAQAAIVVQAAFAGDTIRDLVALARANPGKVSYASPGVGNGAHLVGELLQSAAHVDMVHVPFRSGSETLTAVIGGTVQFSAIDLTTALPSIRERKLKALAVTGPSRAPELPRTPTMVESGYPTVGMRNWTGAAVPAGTPADTVARLEAAIRVAASSTEYQAALRRFGSQTKPSSGDEMATLMAAEFKRWGDVARRAGIKLE